MKSPIQRQLEIFSAALERPPGAEREAFLAQACGGRERVDDVDSRIALGGGLWCFIHVMNGFEVRFTFTASVAWLARSLNPS